MNIVLFDPFVTGHHILYASKIMNYLADRGNNSFFITSEDFREESQLFNLPSDRIIRLRKKWKRYKYFNQALYYKSISQFIDKNDIDIFHILYLDSQTIPLFLALNYVKKIKKRAHIVVTVHWSTNLTGYQGIKSKVKIFLFSILKRYFDLYFVHGTKTKQALIEKLHIRSSKIVTIPYGTEEFIKVNNKECRHKLGLNKDDKVLLLFGGIRKEKGITEFIDCLRYVKSNVTVIIAGEANNEFKTIIKAKKRGIGKNVKILEYLRYIKESEIPIFYGAADVLALPYKKQFSGQSGPLTIATTYGIPIITTDVGELGETVRKNDLGLVVSSEDPVLSAKAIDRFFSLNKNEISRLSKNCERFSIENSWNVMCNKIYNSYEQLITFSRRSTN